MHSIMAPTPKRKALESTLDRRVRARRESSDELKSAIYRPALNDGDHHSEAQTGSELEDQDEESEVEEADTPPDDAAAISFGALAKAQATLSQPGRRTKKRPTSNTGHDSWEDNEALERKAGRKDHRDFNRASKHAPTEVSSKKAVSRKREVVLIAKREHRDPRFEPLTGPVDSSRISAAYSFLDDYREDEMKELKAAIKTAKDEDTKDKLKRALMSMESRKKAQLRKSKEQEVLDKHRKEEKELVKQGKQPFYLKKAEQKKRLLLDQFSSLKGKQLDRVIERRRKKLEGKEKKNIPFARRAVET